MKELSELRRAFDEAKRNTTKFNKLYQDTFEQIVKTPTETKERESAMNELQDGFLTHSLVGCDPLPTRLLPW